MLIACRCANRSSFPSLTARLSLADDVLPKPVCTPQPPTDEQEAKIQEGIRLHDMGAYEEAVQKYLSVLDENPREITALHEASFTYFAQKKYDKALAVARRGAACQSRLLPQFHTSMGNALDAMVRPEEALAVYRAALEMDPPTRLLHFNLAVLLRGTGKAEEAKVEVQRELGLNPNHPGSHLLLGKIYAEAGMRIPAVMALSRFLLLEPSGPRAADTFGRLRPLLDAGVTRGEKSNQINIGISTPTEAQKKEGDFSAVEMGLAISAAASMMDPKERKGKKGKKEEPASEYSRMTTAYIIMGEVLGRAKPEDGFASGFYAAYFAQLQKDKQASAFVAVAWRDAKLEGLAEWTSANGPALDAFAEWDKGYKWPPVP